MKRILSVLLILSMLLAFAACDTKDEETLSTSPSTDAPTEAPTEPEEEETEEEEEETRSPSSTRPATSARPEGSEDPDESRAPGENVDSTAAPTDGEDPSESDPAESNPSEGEGESTADPEASTGGTVGGEDPEASSGVEGGVGDPEFVLTPEDWNALFIFPDKYGIDITVNGTHMIGAEIDGESVEVLMVEDGEILSETAEALIFEDIRACFESFRYDSESGGVVADSITFVKFEKTVTLTDVLVMGEGYDISAITFFYDGMAVSITVRAYGEGGDVTVPEPGEMTAEEWATLFTFENVRIEENMMGMAMDTYLVDGDVVKILSEYAEGEEYGTREDLPLPLMDFSLYFDEFTAGENGEWFAEKIVIGEGEEVLTFLDVCVTVEDGVITKISHTFSFNEMSFPIVFVCSDYGEISIEISASTVKKMEAIAAIEQFFMGEEEPWRNYTSKEIVSLPGSENVMAENLYCFDFGAVSINGSVSGSPSMAMTYLDEDAFYLLYMLSTSDIAYDVADDKFLVFETLEFYPAGADYALASAISFDVENGLLTALSYVAEYYVYDEAGDGELQSSLFIRKTYYDYGMTEVETSPMPDGTYGTVKSFFEAPARTVSFVQWDDFGKYSAEVLYYANGTLDYRVNDYGEESIGEQVVGNDAALGTLDAFVDYLKNLDEADFIMANDAYYYVGESAYDDYMIPDELCIVIGDGSLRATFIWGEMTVELHVTVA